MDPFDTDRSPGAPVNAEPAIAAQASPAKYGAPRLARYLVRNFVDCIDVCETIKRQVHERVEPNDVERMFHEIECMAMVVPNTVSSVIMGFSIPSRILEDQRSLRRLKQLQLDYSISPKPVIRRSDKAVVIAHDVKNLFDLQALEFHLRDAEELKAAGLKPETIKNATKITVKKKDGVKTNFSLILTCSISLSEVEVKCQVATGV